MLTGFKFLMKREKSLIWILIINTGIFLLIGFSNLLFYLSNNPTGYLLCNSIVHPFTYWLALPASLSDLLGKPWTLFTYMFTHEDIFHIVFNLMVLYFSGMIFLRYLDERKFITTYLLGGITGGLFYIIAFNLFPVFKPIIPCAIAIGASASVLAILVATATYLPNLSVQLMFFMVTVKLKWVAIAIVIIDLISIARGNAGGHIAHIGGAVFGYLFIVLLKQRIDLSKIFAVKFANIFSFRKRRNLKVSYRSQRPMTDEEYNAKKVAEQKRIDAILDKISKHGYDSLSREEKEILFKSSHNK